LDYAKGRGKGPLFYSAKTNAESVAHGLTKWVRAIGVTDKDVSPNHSWRHTFKMVAERSGVSERISDAITGHAPVTAGRAYGKPNLSDMAEALKKFPRYLQDE
jgi:integrase